MTVHHLFTSDTLEGGFWICGRCHRVAVSPSGSSAASPKSQPDTCTWCACVYPGCEEEKLPNRSLCVQHLIAADKDRAEQDQLHRELLLTQPPVSPQDDTPIFDPQLDLFFESIFEWADQSDDHYPTGYDPKEILLHPCEKRPTKPPFTLPGLVDAIEEAWANPHNDPECEYRVSNDLGEAAALFIKVLTMSAPIQWVPLEDQRVQPPDDHEELEEPGPAGTPLPEAAPKLLAVYPVPPASSDS